MLHQRCIYIQVECNSPSICHTLSWTRKSWWAMYVNDQLTGGSLCSCWGHTRGPCHTGHHGHSRPPPGGRGESHCSRGYQPLSRCLTCPLKTCFNWPRPILEPIFILVARPTAGRLFYLTQSQQNDVFRIHLYQLSSVGNFN